MKRNTVTLLILLITTCFLFGCQKKETPEEPAEPEKVEEETPVVEEEEEEPAEETKEGMVRSYTTGQWIDETIGGQRPLAIMFGNTVDAVPQFGISHADVVYEVPVEGSYTRLMGIFQDISGLEKIGSIRSCRHYFIYFAKEFDAIYTHYGQAVYAEAMLSRDDVNNLNGMDSSIESIAFYRDSSRKAPHNAFVSESGLKEAIELKQYPTTYNENYNGHYVFAKDDAEVELTDAADAKVVSPGYFVNKPWFVYNEEEKVYYRYQYKDKQIDGGDDTHLSVKNIIIQYCNWSNMDENGYLDIDTMSGGEGKYVTNGKVIDITWKKESEDSPARYYTADGEELAINQGKTWVCVVRNNYKDRLGIFETEEELSAARENE